MSQIFDYTEGRVSAVESALSIDRLAPYVAMAKDDKTKALRLYERNTQLSEALYGPLQALEIVIRNALNNNWRRDLRLCLGAMPWTMMPDRLTRTRTRTSRIRS